MILDSLMTQPWFIFLIILIIFGILVLGVYLFKKYFFDAKTSNNQEKPSEEQIIEDELNNYLVDIEPGQNVHFNKEISESKKENNLDSSSNNDKKESD